MSAGLAVDLGLALLALAMAGWVIAARTARAAAIGFVAYGFLLGLGSVRLGTLDVALTEASMGGLTGLLLLAAVGRLGAGGAGERERPGAGLRAAVAGACALVSAGIAWVVLALPEPGPSLAPQAAAELPGLGLGNPVTAALLAYRSLDTMLEKVVVLASLIGVWSLAADRGWGGRPGGVPPARPDDALVFLARELPPIGVVVAVYLLWNGSDEPGGAFAAAVVLAAMWLLARMAGLVDAPLVSARRLRAVLVAGPLAFFAVGLAGPLWAGGFLAYPDGLAKPIIVAVEVAMTLSVAAALALLVEGPPARDGAP
ncbi:MAG: sodium:proton antiporter [Deltaproteobacteria bacterium]|nr:sodium:proton antiporter [Deltaproteobacteria bacterium]